MRAMARWHRRVALFVMAWLAVLAATGILVNHANDWGLDSRPLAEPLQRWVYGIENVGQDFCATAPAELTDCGSIFGSLDVPGGELLLAEHSIILLAADGSLVEKLPAGQTGLQRLDAAYAEGDAVYLRDAGHTVLTTPDLLDFEPVDAEGAGHLERADWQVNDRLAAITWERLLLDLHAARFLGSFAKAFNDIVGGLILLLAVTGFWLHRIKAKTNGR